MVLLLFQIIASLVLLIASAEFLINAALRISKKIAISPLIVGATIVALGTSLPELVVSLSAALENQTEIAIANLVGSNITNITLILGISIARGNLRVGTTKTQINNLVLLFATILFALSCLLFEQIPKSLGAFWVLSYLGFLIWSFSAGIQGREEEDKKWFKREVVNSKRDNLKPVLFLPVGILGLILSGGFFVTRVAQLAEIMNISHSFLGLTLVALGTSLPELITSIVGVFKKEVKLVEGNILGSNISNIFFIGGLISLTSAITFRTIPVILILTVSTFLVFLIVVASKGKIIPRLWGFFLILIYFSYLFWIYQAR